MRWDDVVKAAIDAAAADPVLLSVYGERIGFGAADEWHVPSLELHLIADGRAPEIWEPVVVQFDQFTDTLEQLMASERALQQLFDHEVPVIIGGVYMWSERQEGAELADNPDRQNFRAYARRFRMTPLQEQYAPPAAASS